MQSPTLLTAFDDSGSSEVDDIPQEKSITSRKMVKRDFRGNVIPQKPPQSGLELLAAAAAEKITCESEIDSAASLIGQWQEFLKFYQEIGKTYSKGFSCSGELRSLLTEFKTILSDFRRYQVSYLSLRYGLTTEQVNSDIQAISLDQASSFDQKLHDCGLKDSGAAPFEWNYDPEEISGIDYTYKDGACLASAGKKLVAMNNALQRHKQVVKTLLERDSESVLLGRIEASTVWLTKAATQFKGLVCKGFAQSLEVSLIQAESLLYEQAYVVSPGEYESLLQNRKIEWGFIPPPSPSPSPLPPLPNQSPQRPGQVTENVRTVCGSWLERHMDNPYPTIAQKKDMATHLNVDVSRINNWFAWKRKLLRFTAKKLEAAMSHESDYDSDV